MYPTLFDALKDLTGLELSFLSVANTFGFFVALSFLAANLAMTRELKRKEEEGQLKPRTIRVTVGKPMPVHEYISNGLMGFLLGYKLIPIFFHKDDITVSVQEFIFSTQGNFLEGLLLAGIFLYMKYTDDKKQRLPVPEEKDLLFHPWQNMGSLTIVAAITGILGAKVFHWLEYWDSFVANPLENLVSPSGLTFFGGLICGGAGVLWYASKKGIPVKHMLDVGGPAMMLAYGLGRFGCHFSGDGDWGIVNTAPQPAWMSFLPKWSWAYNYPNNVARECDPTGGTMPCRFEDTPFLQLPVFPTPLYEALAALLLFTVLWFLRKRIKAPGGLFGIYMIFAGVERFLVEKIRVNSTYEILGFHPTQAEIISILMILGGLSLYIFSVKQFRNNPSTLPGS